MKRIIYILVVLGLLVSIAPAQAAVRLTFNISDSWVELDGPPIFIYPASLGFYVAVGIPYDMFFIDSYYYMCRGSRWYVSDYYDGPWVGIEYHHLPGRLRQREYRQIIRIRDEEYINYQRDREHYRGKEHRPEDHRVRQERRGDEHREDYHRGRGRR